MTNYPVGAIGEDIEIHFLHYPSFHQAKMKWDSRKSRLPENDDQLIFKICDRDGFDERHLRAFSNLHFNNKICIIKKGRFDIFGLSQVHEFETDDDCCPPGPELWDGTSHLIDAATKE